MLQRRVRDAIVIGLVGVAEHAHDHRAQVVKEVLREHKGRGETVQARSDGAQRTVRTRGRWASERAGTREGGWAVVHRGLRARVDAPEWQRLERQAGLSEQRHLLKKGTQSG